MLPLLSPNVVDGKEGKEQLAQIPGVHQMTMWAGERKGTRRKE